MKNTYILIIIICILVYYHKHVHNTNTNTNVILGYDNHGVPSFASQGASQGASNGASHSASNGASHSASNGASHSASNGASQGANEDQEEHNYIDHIYTGQKWECVEYARRWLIVAKGFTFDTVKNARDIWFITHVTSITNHHHRVPFISIYNTPEKLPTIGSLLIYQTNTQQPHGHVSVVSDMKDDKIYVSEQNKDNTTYWKGPYARIIHIMNNSITHEPYLIGWKTIRRHSS